jgi:hypothetical protein
MLSIAMMLGANPTTLLDEQSGFYKSASKVMIPLYDMSCSFIVPQESTKVVN